MLRVRNSRLFEWLKHYRYPSHMDTLLNAGIAGLIAYGGSALLLNGNKNIMTMFGKMSPAAAIGTTVAGSTILVGVVTKNLMDEETLDSWDDSFGGYFEASAIAATSAVLPLMLMPGSAPDMMGMMKIAAIGGGASLLATYTSDMLWPGDDVVITSTSTIGARKTRSKKKKKTRKVASYSAPGTRDLSYAELETLGL